jgi:hypothetical protein
VPHYSGYLVATNAPAMLRLLPANDHTKDAVGDSHRHRKK